MTGHQLTVAGGQALTMSSLEISELVESRHDSVKRTIERLAERGVIQLPPMVDVPNHLGQTVSVYKLEKRDSYVVVTLHVTASALQCHASHVTVTRDLRDRHVTCTRG